MINQIKMNLQDENLVVDYLAFNIRDLNDHAEVKKLGYAFFQKMKYNFKIVYYNDLKGLDSTLKSNSIIYFSFYRRASWQDCILYFPGTIANHFYNHVKQKGFPWKLFGISKSRITLGRLDIVFIPNLETKGSHERIDVLIKHMK